MSAASIIRRIRAAGGEITRAEEGIKLKIPASLRDDVIAEIKAHKDAIRRAFKFGSEDLWDADDYRFFYDERAGIGEFDGGLPRPEAEARAFACCVVEWLNRNPMRSPPGRCLGCGNANHACDPLLPFGTDTSGHAWLHGACWPAWYRSREAEAVVALAAMGIRP